MTNITQAWIKASLAKEEKRTRESTTENTRTNYRSAWKKKKQEKGLEPSASFAGP